MKMKNDIENSIKEMVSNDLRNLSTKIKADNKQGKVHFYKDDTSTFGKKIKSMFKIKSKETKCSVEDIDTIFNNIINKVKKD